MGISVLMSVYEKEKPAYLEEALRSLEQQSRKPEEIVLVEDGPLPTELERVVQAFEQKEDSIRRRVIRLPENILLGRALAEGLKACSEELVARMDSDDIAVPERFERQLSYMEQHPETAVLGGLIEEFDTADPTSRRVKHMPLTPKELRSYSRYRNPVNHMTVMFRKSAVEAAGGYRHFPYLEDYDLWSRMLARGEHFANLDTVLVRARTEKSFYGRRGGFAYFRRYRKLRQQQKRLGLLSSAEYAKAVLLTAGMTLAPRGLRSLFYRKVLRKC